MVFLQGETPIIDALLPLSGPYPQCLMPPAPPYSSLDPNSGEPQPSSSHCNLQSDTNPVVESPKPQSPAHTSTVQKPQSPAHKPSVQCEPSAEKSEKENTRSTAEVKPHIPTSDHEAKNTLSTAEAKSQIPTQVREVNGKLFPYIGSREYPLHLWDKYDGFLLLDGSFWRPHP